MSHMFETGPHDPERHPPRATRSLRMFCGHCSNMHIIWYDGDKVICEVTVSQEQLAEWACDPRFAAARSSHGTN